MRTRNELTISNAISTRSCAACLFSFVILGSVLLFHDYPGHGHWEFLHDIIQGKAIDDDMTSVRASVQGASAAAVIDESPLLSGLIVLTLLIANEAGLCSNNSIMTRGMRSPPCDMNMPCNSIYFNVLLLHTDLTKGSRRQTFVSTPQIPSETDFCRHIFIGSGNRKNCLCSIMEEW